MKPPHLYESRSGTLHRMHQEPIPPERTTSFVIPVFLPSPDPYHRQRKDNGNKDDDQMPEPEPRREGLEHVSIP